MLHNRWTITFGTSPSIPISILRQLRNLHHVLRLKDIGIRLLRRTSTVIIILSNYTWLNRLRIFSGWLNQFRRSFSAPNSYLGRARDWSRIFTWFIRSILDAGFSIANGYPLHSFVCFQRRALQWEGSHSGLSTKHWNDPSVFLHLMTRVATAPIILLTLPLFNSSGVYCVGSIFHKTEPLIKINSLALYSSLILTSMSSWGVGSIGRHFGILLLSDFHIGYLNSRVLA